MMANPPGKLTPEILPGVGFSTFQTLKNTEARLNQINALSVIPATIEHPVRTVTVSGAATTADEFLDIDATLGNIVLSIPIGVRYLDVSRGDGTANTVNITFPPGHTVNGGTSLALTAQYQSYTISYLGGTVWRAY